MSTPAMAVTSCMRTILFSFLAMWLFTLTISRAWTFNNALQSELTKRKNERWLVERCGDPEFYFNMKEHTDLCANVIANANSSIILNSLYAMAVTTHLCGSASCTDMMQHFVQRLGWQIIGLMTLIVLFSPNLLFLLYRASSNRFVHGKERHLMAGTGKLGAGLRPDHPLWSPYYAALPDYVGGNPPALIRARAPHKVTEDKVPTAPAICMCLMLLPR